MTITNGYCTLAEFKQRAMIQGTDANRDADMEGIIQAVSRLIDNDCRRIFYATTPASARYFTAPTSRRCYIDDVITITSVKTDIDRDGTYETTLTTSDYWTMPANETPKTWLEIKPIYSNNFPARQTNGVEITATWGFSAVPDVVKQACIIQSMRVWARRESPLGVVGVNDIGTAQVINTLDPDVSHMLDPMRRIWF